MEEAAAALSQAVRAYKKTISEVTDADLGAGLTAALQTKLNDALTAVRTASAAHHEAEVRARTEYDELITWWAREGTKSEANRRTLEAQVNQLRRCYTIPAAVTDGCLDFDASEESVEPPSKRLLTSLQHGLRLKEQKERELDGLREQRMSCMPLLCLETRGRVRQLNAASQPLMGLPTMNFKPLIASTAPTAVLPPSLRVAFTNLTSLVVAEEAGQAQSDKPKCLSNVSTADGAVTFSVEGVDFVLKLAGGGGGGGGGGDAENDAYDADLMVKSSYRTEALDFLTPGVVCSPQKAVREMTPEGEFFRFRWLEPFAGPPHWEHIDVTPAEGEEDFLPSEPLKTFGQVRVYEALDTVIRHLAERICNLRAVERFGSSIPGFSVTTMQAKEAQPFPPLSTVVSLKNIETPEKSFTVVYPVDVKFRPVHVVCGVDESGFAALQRVVGTDHLVCGVTASVEGALSKAVNFALGGRGKGRGGGAGGALCQLPSPVEVLGMIEAARGEDFVADPKETTQVCAFFLKNAIIWSFDDGVAERGCHFLLFSAILGSSAHTMMGFFCLLFRDSTVLLFL